MNCLQKIRCSRFLLGACRRSAKSSQNHPRSAPRDPKSDPGGVKSGPGEPQERPGRGPGATSERSWKRFWSLPGLIWELFGSPRDFIFKLFRCCPRTLRLQPLCPSNAGSAGPALAFTILSHRGVRSLLPTLAFTSSVSTLNRFGLLRFRSLAPWRWPLWRPGPWTGAHGV